MIKKIYLAVCLLNVLSFTIAYSQTNSENKNGGNNKNDEEKESAYQGLEEQKSRTMNLKNLLKGKEYEEYEDVGSRDYWFYQQRAFPNKFIPAGAHFQALMQTIEMEKIQKETKNKSLMFANNNWEEIGPTNQGGRIRGFALHPKTQGIIYAAGVNGGVWKSTNSGDSWTTKFDNMPTLNVIDIDIDPSNPEVVYACTGELARSAATPNTYLGSGVYKTTDGGSTWKQMGLANLGSTTKIWVHRQKPNIVYCGAVNENSGFYRSTDAGATWNKIASGIPTQEFVCNPANNDEIYICGSGQVKKSTNAGETFTSSNSGMGGSGRTSIDIAESNPNILYSMVAVPSGDADYANVYKSTNKGASWTKVITSPKEVNTKGGWFNAQTFHNFYIRVYPGDENMVFVGGIDIYRSTNGGVSFSNMTNYYTDPDNPDKVHADQMNMKFDPITPELIFASNDGGLYVSVDGGEKYTKLTINLPITQFYRLGVDQTREFRVYGGSQDNGSSGTIGNGSFDKSWFRVLGGDGFYTVVDPLNSDFVYAMIPNGEGISKVDVTNKASTINRVPIGNAPVKGEWESPLEVIGKDIYLGVSGTVYRNSGSGWNDLKSGGGTISAIGISPLNKDLIVIGSTNGSIKYSNDYGATWKTSSPTFGRYVRDVEFDPIEQSRVYCVGSGYSAKNVFVSNDAGATFKDITNNLPKTPINSIQIDPNNNSNLFLGTDAGVFVSLNGGSSWQPFNEGLARSPVTDLKLHKTSKTLIACTHGRSMWKASIDGIKPAATIIYPNGGEAINAPGKMNLIVNGFSSPIRVFISYDNGGYFEQIADGMIPTGDSISLPLIKAKNAKIKVVEISSGSEIISNSFTINAKANVLNSGSNSMPILNAIEIRNSEMWGAVESASGEDSLLAFKLSNFASLKRMAVSGLENKIIDLAYNAEKNEFYALTTKPDFTEAKLYKIDTNGVATNIPITNTTLCGIAFTPLGLSTISPNGKMSLLSPDGAVLQPETDVKNLTGTNRISLAYDGSTFTNGVKDRLPSAIFPNELHQIYAKNPPEFRKLVPLVVQGGDSPDILGIAYDEPTKTYYISTPKGIFKFVISEVYGSVSYSNESMRGNINIKNLLPNPIKDDAKLNLDIKNNIDVSIKLYNSKGALEQNIFNGNLEKGSHTIDINAKELASGLYYVTIFSGITESRTIKFMVVK